MKRAMRWIALLLVSACGNDPNRPSEPPVVSIQPTTQWSGGEIRLTSAAFATADLPVLVAGTETLAVRRISDSIVAVTVPLGSSGSVSIELAAGKKRYPAGEVMRVGFRSTKTSNPLFGTELHLTYDGLTPIVVGGTWTGGRTPVQSLNLSTMEVVGYPGIFAVIQYGVGPTDHPNEFVVLDTADRPALWRLWPAQELIDTLSSTLKCCTSRQVSRLSDSVWIRTTHHVTLSYRGTQTLTGILSYTMESPWAIALSPRGDRAALAISGSFTGVPVYNSLTGDTAFALGPHFQTSYGGTGFSPDGERLYFLGGPQGASFGDSLLSVGATTGEILASAKVPPIGLPFKFATDPVEELEYVEVLQGGRPTILIYDRDLRLLGRLPAPDNLGTPTCDETCIQGVIGVDRARNLLHVVWNGVGSSNYIWTYDLLPSD
jgi:hypothetical protein